MMKLIKLEIMWQIAKIKAGIKANQFLRSIAKIMNAKHGKTASPKIITGFIQLL